MSYYDIGELKGYGVADTKKYKVGEYRIDESQGNQKGLFCLKVKSENVNYTEYIIYSTDGAREIDNYNSQTTSFSYYVKRPDFYTTILHSRIQWREKDDANNYVNPTGDWDDAVYRRFFNLGWDYEDADIREVTGCNIPIYDFTSNDHPSQEDIERVNKYIRNGDDSGADNYSDLHPIKYHTTVWLDGLFPNLFYKTEIVEGEPTEVVDYGILIQADGGGLSPVSTTLDKTYSINSMSSATYSEYGNTPSGLSSVVTYYVRFVSEDVSATLNDACYLNFKVDKSGNVSDIQTSDSVSGNCTISYETGTPSDTDYPDDSPSWNHNVTNNYMSGANTLTKTYMLGDTELRAFGNFLWTNTFKDNLLSLTNYPLENVVSLKAMPISEGGASEEIKIGNVATGINAPIVNSADRISVTVGSVKCPRIFQNFLDYTSVDISIYLPFIGFKKIDSALAMGRTIRVRYWFDVVLGTCMAVIDYKDVDSNFLSCDVYQGNCGIDISVASTNRADIENGYIGNAISGIANLVSGNFGGVLKDAVDTATQGFHSDSTGVGNPSLMGALDMTCRLIIRRPKKFTPPSSYGHTYGYPCHLYGKLSDFSFPDNAGVEHNSFTVCENFVVSEMDNILDEEKRMIKELLEEGVYL